MGAMAPKRWPPWLGDSRRGNGPPSQAYVAPMGILAWIVLGGLAGWVGSMIMGTNARMGLLANIIVGVIGSVIGGWVFNYCDNYGVTGYNL